MITEVMSRKKLIILIVICLLVSFAYWYVIIFLIIPENSPPEHFSIKGELIYLKNESDPNNTAIGVWIEIILEDPKKVKYGNLTKIIILQNYEPIVDEWLKSSVIHTENNITIEHIDVDNDSHISSHDMLHIYGHTLTNCKIILSVVGYAGTLSVYIP